VICGGSVIGLSLAAMLGKDGHRVTVLESDVDQPPQTAAQDWDRWERTGVPQFRQPHNLFARFRQVCDEELPGPSERLLAAGCVWVDYLDPPPPDLPGVPHVAGVRTEDGAELPADLVVDATGGKTRSDMWLTDLGGRPPESELLTPARHSRGCALPRSCRSATTTRGR
jgi:glycine/D-amino acid oxidase-like deaminating enzyme